MVCSPRFIILLFQSSSPLGRDMADTLQVYDMLYTIPLMRGEAVVSLLFPVGLCRAMWLFPACIIWCCLCQQPQFRLPKFSA